MIDRINIYVYFLILIPCWGCQPQPADVLFTSLPATTTGIDFKNTLGESEVFNVLNYGYFYNGGGVAIGDINNDGLPDIYFTGNMKASHLYLNKGNFEFEEIAEKAGVAAAGLWNTGVTMADVNNDGWLDIYVCRSAATLPDRRKNLLFINNRNHTFSEMSGEYGLDDPGYSTQAAFFDYDRDGDLDMYLLNHSVQEYAGFNQLLKRNKNRTHQDYGDKLYQNNLIPAEKESFGRFKDVTQQAGIKNTVLGFGLGVAVADLNNDGWLDIYVSNDYNEEDYCYINQRDGSFRESLREYFDKSSLFSMGSDVADINNDGLPDVFTLDMLPEDNFRQKMTSGSDNYEKKQALYEAGFYYQSMRNMLQLNNGDGSFSEIGQLAGVSNTDWSWAALFGDYDNDGWKDLFVTNGYKSDYTNMDFMAFAADQRVKAQQSGQQAAVSELLNNIPSIEVPNYVYQNRGDLRFDDKTEDWGLSRASNISHGGAYGDLDADGDLDLVINNVNAVATVYRNNADKYTINNYLKIQLRDCPLNRLGFGATVTIQHGGQQQTQTLMPTRGFQSSVEPLLHFGLARDSIVDQLRIQWPDGTAQQQRNVKVNQLIRLSYAPDPEISLRKGLYDNHYFSRADPAPILNYRHQENRFNDFKREPLLPHMLSTQGPYLSTADVNGDSREDVYIGGASGQSGRLFLQESGGTFTASLQADFQLHRASEDIRSVFFDADGDGDPDLYVCSGGNEAEFGSEVYVDRLYLNDGSGNFSASDYLPALSVSSSSVAVGDIDQDGDSDLFVGGRLIPGQYPLSPGSYLLLNDGQGRFSDATETHAPGLRSLGMVTDGLWSDYDQDQDMDLILVGEWMPISIFTNEDGRLARSTEIENSRGWWNCLVATDMDQDGDPDYLAGNFGWNSQLRATPQQPLRLYAKDFDQNGTLDPILAYYNGGEEWPVPPRDDLVGQLPGLKKKFLFYEDFAKAKITDLFDSENLVQALRLEAQQLATSYLNNQGDGQFVLTPLPLEAQIAPVFSILPLDIDQDGHTDLVTAGNLYETREQFGRYDAHHGQLWLGQEAGTWTLSSGSLQIRGAVRDMVMLKMKDGKDLLLIGKNDEKLELRLVNQ